MLKTIFEEFVSDPKRHMAYQRESLALQASEMIFELMEDEGVTRAQLAELIGASRAHITQLLSGSRNMTVHTLSDLAFVLGHKIRLDSVPLSGSQSSVGQYVALPWEKQQGLFGTSFPGPSEADNQQEEGGEVEGSLPIAA